jgi:geranylgeranyl pyrophosphate synthase
MPFCQLQVRTDFLLQESNRKTNFPSVVANPQAILRSLKDPLDPFGCVAVELELVEQNLSRSIRSDEHTLTEIASHLIQGGGKRIRPMVALLVFKMFGGERIEDIVDMATALELIHTATLLHDDIIDGAEIRRGKQSAFKRFGLKATLVAGDFLFIKAFEFAGKFDDRVVQWTADACTRLTEGEMLQGSFNRNTNVTVNDYLEIVRRKTASLFHTGAKVGAHLAGASSDFVEALGQYALNLGVAFQIIDDVLDVVGQMELLGKPVGMDLRDGNPSIPIILALREGHKAVLDAFQSPSVSDQQIQEALQAITQGTAIEEATLLSETYAQQALRAISKVTPSPYRDSLKTLVHVITDRQY